MKRALALLVGGGLILGSVLTAHAQAPTVSFGGQMRIYGFAFDNITDFTDSAGGLNRDSQSFYFQRWRLFTTIESADKKARAYWALEVGDITWGANGGASGGEFGCVGTSPTVNPTVTVPPPAGSPPGTPGTPATVTPGTPGAGARVNNNSGGCLGADGVNVETKNIWIWLDTSGWVPGTDIRLGIQNIAFLGSPWGAFADDDAAAITVNWKGDPVDVQVWTAKVAEFNNANADDVDMYAARLGVNLTKDFRVTLEGLAVNNNLLDGHSFGDTFWIGSTVAVKIATISLDGGVVYGQRQLTAAAPGLTSRGPTVEESGVGFYAIARAPVGPVNVNGIFWYTSGDNARGPASPSNTAAADSDKLPVPIAGASWGAAGMPFIAEWLNGLPTIGNPAIGQNLYNDPTGTWGVGGSATFAVTPALTVGGGVAYVSATDAPGRWGDNVIEVDGGLIYRFNPNVTLNLFGGVLFPDVEDMGYAVAFRTNYGF